MNNFKIKFLFIFIILLSIFLRLYRLGNTPFSLNLDEAAIGYDAFSILQTGKDQFGIKFPLAFRSTNDYKLPLYIYLTVPAIEIFGLNEFSVRVVSAISGIGTIIAAYFLTMELFNQKKSVYRLALLVSFFLCLSPWHLQFSRGAFESNLAVAINIFAVLFFVKGVRGQKYIFLLSSFLFGISFFAYHSSRFVCPLILFTLLILFRKNLSKKALFFFFFIYGFFFVAFLPLLNSKNAQMRFMSMNIFNIEESQTNTSKIILEDQKRGFTFSGKIFHNRRLAVVSYDNFKNFALNYAKHFNPDFYYEGDSNNMYHAPNFGLVLFFEPIFYFLGMMFFLKRWRFFPYNLLLIWFFISFIPSATVWQAPSSVRSLIVFPTWQILMATGLLFSLNVIKNKAVDYLTIGKIILIFCLLFSFASYLHQYHVHLNHDFAKDWFYEKKRAVIYTQSVAKNYEKIIVSNLKTDWPYMFWLFYDRYDPAKYLKVDGGTKSGDFRDNEKFSKYEFLMFHQKDTPMNGKWLVIGYPEEFKPLRIKSLDGTHVLVRMMNIIHKLYYPNGKLALVAAENKFIEKIVPIDYKIE